MVKVGARVRVRVRVRARVCLHGMHCTRDVYTIPARSSQLR